MSAGFLPLLSQMLTMSKQATVRTAGIVGDDLAINSKQLIGGQPGRKLPMVYAVAKGSLKNKFFYLIPAAFALSVTLPGLIMPALTLGGAYLCYEGVEKFLEKKPKTPPVQKSEAEVPDHAAWEKRHVRKAIKTDLILSAEITAVALWTVAAAPILVQVAAMAAAGIAMTVGVYGIVGGIIKLPDIGAALAKKEGKGIFAKAQRGFGRALTATAPGVIKTVGIIGTVAMFLVGGGMVLHGIPGGEHLIATGMNAIAAQGALGGLLHGAALMTAETATGVAAGFVAVPVMKVIEPPLKKTAGYLKKLVQKIRPKNTAEKAPQTAPSPATAPASKAKPVASILNNAPDVKAALNIAGKAENDNQSAKQATKAPIAPKTPGP